MSFISFGKIVFAAGHCACLVPTISQIWPTQLRTESMTSRLLYFAVLYINLVSALLELTCVISADTRRVLAYVLWV